MGLESADKVWKKDETAALIALYESERSLYDKNDKHYSDTQKRKEGFERIRQVMQRIRPGCTIADIKSRIKYLRNQYASELLRRNISIDSNIYTKDSYKPVMWCFGLLQFLDDFITAKKYSSKVETSEEEKGDEPEVSDKTLSTKTSVAKNVSTKSSKESCSETTGKRKELLNGDISELNKKVKKRKVDSSSSSESAEKHTPLPSTLEISAVEQMPSIPTIEQIPTIPVVEQMPAIKDGDREDIFGHYVASEMRALRDNPVLYLQTKQSILEILTSANFELINPE